jgi:ferritin-like metal-binding protein YciE
VQTLRELLEHELQAVEALERGLARAFQDLADESAKKDVRQAFLRQQRITEKVRKRLARIGGRLRDGDEARPVPSFALEGMLREKEAFLAAAPRDALLDYYNLQLAARITQYAIAAYQGLVETAERLELLREAHPLRGNLEEKRAALSTLQELARGFDVAFRETGGVLQAVPKARQKQNQALVGGPLAAAAPPWMHR